MKSATIPEAMQATEFARLYRQSAGLPVDPVCMEEASGSSDGFRVDHFAW